MYYFFLRDYSTEQKARVASQYISEAREHDGHASQSTNVLWPADVCFGRHDRHAHLALHLQAIINKL